MLESVDKFLCSHGLDVSGIDREEILRTFDEEMTAGLRGEPSSLAMIPSFISIDREVRVNQPVVVLDAGGTNLRTAVVSITGSGAVNVGQLRKCAMPGTEGELSRAEFFEAFADFVLPYLDQSETIGFCFSYAAEVTPDCDARLLYWSKQIEVPSVVNTMIGSGLRESLVKRGYQRRVVILNDTVATLLAGKSVGLTRGYSAYVGFILGTGTNTSYVESNRNISKRSDLDPAGSMAINVESGGFKRISQCRFDRLLDQRTNDLGAYTFEKMISGAYLGSLSTVVMREAARAGMFAGSAAAVLAARADSEGAGWQPFSNKEVDDFCGGAPAGDNPFLAPAFSAADRELVKALCTPVYERAAVLAAVNIASAVIKTGAGDDPEHPVCVNVDGSTYYRTLTADFQQRVQSELRTLLDKRSLCYELVRVDDSPVIGAAVAGLMV